MFSSRQMAPMSHAILFYFSIITVLLIPRPLICLFMYYYNFIAIIILLLIWVVPILNYNIIVCIHFLLCYS